MKTGLNTARAWKGRPMAVETIYKETKNKYGDVTIREVRVPAGSITFKESMASHKKRHPNDKNIKNPNKGIFWGKRGYKDDLLDEFYATHVYTFIDKNLNKGWVFIGDRGEEE